MILIVTNVSFTKDSDLAGISPDDSIEFKNQTALNVVQNAIWTGSYSISVDGLGTTGTTGNIQVQKPAGAIVQAAYLIAAAGWGDPLPSGSISIEGQPITWVETYIGAGNTTNCWADVTSILAPIIDAESAGIIDILIYEADSYDVDGEVLAVVFNDPNVSQTNSIIFLFGGQAMAGEYFNINLAEPIDLSVPNFHIYMGLGISFSAQWQVGYPQYSIVNVNDIRLTSAAGGMDDGDTEGGALLTVGGIGDSYSNPIDPFTHPYDDFYDDELYNLNPFVSDGDDFIQVYTQNPSDDDNIFFAWIESTISAALGESIIITFPDDEVHVNSDLVVTAVLNNSVGDPLTDTNVKFKIIGGINKGIQINDTSDTSGHVQWSFSSHETGPDSIQASFYSTILSDTIRSNIAIITWIAMADENFYVTISPDTLLLLQGESDLVQVELDTLNGFSDMVDLSCLNAPSGVTVDFTPESIQYPNVSQCTISTTPLASVGTHALIIQGESGLLTHTDTLTLIIQSATSIPIYPAMSTSQVAGAEFWVDINIGESGNDVTNLYGASFLVTYDSNYLTPDADNITRGGFIDSPAMHFVGPMDSPGTLFLAVTRTDAPGVSGWGSVLRIPFQLNTTAPDTQLCIQILDAQANDPDWNPISLVQRDSCFQVVPWILVWPGDTDNDGTVDQADLLPIGLSWGKTGYPRAVPNYIEWEGLPCRPWDEDVRYTYADANGDGVVNQNDISSIHTNWDSTHNHLSINNLNPKPPVSRQGGIVYLEAREIPNNQYEIDVCLREAEDVLSLGIALNYPEGVEVSDVEGGAFWSHTPLYLHHDDTQKKTLGIGIGQIREQGGVSGQGCVTTIQLKAAAPEQIYEIEIDEVSGIDASGNMLTFDVVSLIQPDTKQESTVPRRYAFYSNYPNPFNPRTTLSFDLPNQSFVRLIVYDVLGNEVKQLLNSVQQAGCHQVEWDGNNRSGEQVSSGIYYFRFEADMFIQVQKGLLMK